MISFEQLIGYALLATYPRVSLKEISREAARPGVSQSIAGTDAAARPKSCMSPIPDRKSGTACSRGGRQRSCADQAQLALEQLGLSPPDQLVRVARRPIALAAAKLSDVGVRFSSLADFSSEAEGFSSDTGGLFFCANGFFFRLSRNFGTRCLQIIHCCFEIIYTSSKRDQLFHQYFPLRMLAG